MKNLKGFLLVALCGSMIIISCTKDDEPNVQEIQNYEVEDEINAETFAEDIENAIEDELDFADVFFDSGDTKDGQTKGPTTRTDVNDGCATRTASAERGTWPNTVTINLSEGCKGRHGQAVRGQIVVTLSNNPRMEGATKTVTLNDFEIGEVTINGTRTVTNMGRDDNQNSRYTRTEDITISRGDVSIKRRSSITTTRLTGEDTDTREDDSLERTGTVEGTNTRGEEYSTEITTPIVRRGDCRWPVSGVRVISRGDKRITLDYGDGTCDNLVTATLGDRSKEFEIK